MITIYQALSLMIMFGSLILTVISVVVTISKKK
ncbi:putative holin-like toxin [Bacillus sp. FJAT-49736]|nr:putative holin-like toxin [Bacillus sp. FJAT-49736]